jgi:hypothetical protein
MCNQLSSVVVAFFDLSHVNVVAEQKMLADSGVQLARLSSESQPPPPPPDVLCFCLFIIIIIIIIVVDNLKPNKN